MSVPHPEPPPLRATVVIDYQNMHLTGHDLFDSTRNLPRHESLVHPLLFAQTVLRVRNAIQGPEYRPGTLRRVLVYRGNPSPEHDPDAYARNLAQKAEWERDPRVHVTLRPLKYYYARDAAGHVIRDVHGNRSYVRVEEKGVDVLCALAVVREARDPDTDLVILASADSDLEPAVQEALSLRTAKIETTSWWCPRNRGHQITARVWNTRLDENDFTQVRDLRDYR